MLKKSTKKLRAKKLSKAYIQSGLNQNRLAKKLKVTRQTINRKIHKKEVQDCLKNYLDSDELKRKLTRVAKEGLSATKVLSATVIMPKTKKKERKAEAPKIELVDIPDYKTRHSFWHDLMNAKGHIKDTGSKQVVQIFTIGDIVSQAEALENVPARSKR